MLARRVRLLLPLLVVACGDPAPAPNESTELADHIDRENDVTVVDASGRAHHFPTPPERVVSLVPSATEAVLALGKASVLIGRTDYDDHPEVRQLPSVGGGLQPNIETLLGLDPELVIRFDAESDPFTPDRLDRAGIPHFAVRPDRIDDIHLMVEHLGAILDRQEEAVAHLQAMDEALGEIREAVSDRPRPRVAYLLGGTPPWVAGKDTFIHELLEIAGAENVFSDLASQYGEVSLEAIARRDPDWILVVEGAPIPPNLPTPERVKPVSPLTRSPTLRLAEAAWELAADLHPDVFR